MAKRIINTTPRQDGFYMPGEFESQKRVWMLWHALYGRGKWRVFIRRIRRVRFMGQHRNVISSFALFLI